MNNRFLTELRESFKIPLVGADHKVTNPNAHSKDEWDHVRKLMKTMSVIEIAALPEVNISESTMYKVRKINKWNVVRSNRRKEIPSDNKPSDEQLMQTWKRHG